jgi:two-component system sensor histidine kinase RegB
MNSQSSTLIGSLARAFLDNSDHSVRRQQLRTALWIRLFAIVIVCVIGLVAEFWLGVNLPWPVFAGVILVFIALNALAAWRYQSEARVGRFEVAAHLGADLLSFSVLLYFTGGVTNPFVSFYLPLIGLAAALLPRGQVFVLAVVSVLAYSFLMSNYWPLVLSNPSDGIHFHLIGMWMNFMVSVLILVVFVARLSASVRQREHDLRQAQGLLVRESKLAVLGNQAASIAHQLGTPAATLVTILADWVEDSALQAYSDDVWVMQNQLQSIQKTLAQLRAQVEFNVGVRGSNGWVSVNPQTWLDGFVQQWRNRNPHAQLKLCVTGMCPP